MSWLSENFELSRHGEMQNVRPMEGLRGFAVSLVFLVHYATLMSPWTGASSTLASVLDIVHTVGQAGVDLFFVLSGYLIYGSLISRHQKFLPFIRRRIARVYPAFSVVFAVYLLLSFLRPEDSKIPNGTLPALNYVLQNFLLLPGIFKIQPMITVAWSLSYEMLYYIVLPAIMVMMRLQSKSSAFRICLFTCAGAAIAVYCAIFGGPVRLAMFIAGILLHEALRTEIVTLRPGLVVALVIAGLAFTAAPFSGHLAYVVKILVLFGVFFTLCYLCFTQPRCWLSRGFSVAPLRWLGNMSYSYYLLHGLTLKVIVSALAVIMPKVAHEALFVIGTLPIMFVATLIPAAGLFLYIERPFSLVKETKSGSKRKLAEGSRV